jgi:hypothetical protein
VRIARVGALLPLLVVATTLVPVHAATGTGPCALRRGADEPLKHFSKRQISCAVDAFGPVPGGRERAICIAARESHLFPKATSLTGMYLGLYQHAAADWDRRYDDYTRAGWQLPTSALKGRTNAIVAIRMVARAGGWTPAGWPVEDC